MGLLGTQPLSLLLKNKNVLWFQQLTCIITFIVIIRVIVIPLDSYSPVYIGLCTRLSHSHNGCLLLSIHNEMEVLCLLPLDLPRMSLGPSLPSFNIVFKLKRDLFLEITQWISKLIFIELFHTFSDTILYSSESILLDPVVLTPVSFFLEQNQHTWN